MYTTSAAFKSAIKATDREVRGYLRFNGDNTKLLRGCDGLISIKHTAKLADRDRPMMGCANSMFCVVDFFNEGVTGISLANSFFDAYIGVVLEDTGTAPSGSIEPDTATVEYVFIGRFWISEVQRGDVATRVTAYDAFGKLNKEYVPTVTDGGNGYAVKDILNDINTQCQLGLSAVTADLGYVSTLYSGTCRQVAGWVINAGAYADPVNLVVGRNAESGNYALRRLARQWTFKDDAEYLIDDSTVYLGGLDKNEDFTVNSITSGTEDNPIIVGNGTGIVGEDPYMTETLATTYYNSVHGITFTPMSLEFRGNPAILVGDVMKVTTGGNTYYCYTQKITTVFNGGLKQTLECFGDSEYHYSMSTSPTQAQIRNVSTLAQEIQEGIETARNGVCTQILDNDGTWKEFVIANNQDLSQATSVWRFNINGLAHSDAYSGGTYTLAMDTQGRIVANVIQTGILTDAAGKNSWNLDTGAFTITDGTVNITTNAVNDSRIILNYGNLSTSMSPVGFRSIDRDNKRSYELYRYGVYSYGWNDSFTQSYTLGRIAGAGLYLGATNASYPTQGQIYIYDEQQNTAIEMLGGGGNYASISVRGENKTRIRLHSSLGFSYYDSNGNIVSELGSSLVFYDSNGVATANYPATGQAILDSTDVKPSGGISTATQKNVRTITLQPGKYVLFGYVCFNANDTGVRVINISTTSASYNPDYGWNDRKSALPSGWYTTCNVTMPVVVTSATTYYLVAYQNSGGTLDLKDYQLKAVKLL